ncbi:putative mediator of RNA polymerase II transcription subunit 26 isoform X2 [Scaptodrosophila lebanonensis]|uniref:Mediator of RNA polymerase II transcription subunit 26 isoform X2 n=1 Tax=Drosophila lebanonensis TaxID=7225 RepID=A0A6J2TBA1_DROLE|nr:putative mediator of RNA polymerase II transcription subunit 26 isoform X2 [Scaptodrosophila lebanonensis]
MSDASGSGHGGYQKLPPGWDCKYDQATGNCYYINYLTKAMQLEDPRGRYKQLQNERCSTESIALQHMVTQQHHQQQQQSHPQPQPQPSSYGNSPYHVYPSNNLTAVRAFQERNQLPPSLHNISSSPLLSTSSRGHLEMSSPLPFQRARMGNMSRRSTIQETSFTNQIDTDAVVTKIQNMFPTAGENHIRLLLKRYMKNIFPKADEMLLLDILANADNNVQFASEKLISLGYAKRDVQPHKPNNRPPQLDGGQEAGNTEGVQHIPLRPKEYTPEEKTAMQALLLQKYPQIAERIILMALESVNYAEDRATQILQIVQDEDEQRAQKHDAIIANDLSLKTKLATQEEQVDGHAIGDSILTVVLETPTTSTTTTTTKSKPPHKQHQRHILPSINVTTPTTATTQIILSHPSPMVEDGAGAGAGAGSEEAIGGGKVPNHANINNTIMSPISTPSCHSSTVTHSYASPTQSPTRRYEPLTTKSILARSRSSGGSCNSNNNYNNNNNMNNNNNYNINGYLHGSNSNANNNNASSYSSYTTTSMTSSSLSSANSNSNSSSILSKLRAVGSRARAKTDSLKHAQRTLGSDNTQNSDSVEFQSLIERMATMGPNTQLAKGADENLLLADYVTWNGPNTALTQKQPARGPDAGLLGERTYKPTGRNAELCKGAKAGLAKGSIYAHGNNKNNNIKCN